VAPVWTGWFTSGANLIELRASMSTDLTEFKNVGIINTLRSANFSGAATT
jgi:hypothetical protein